MKLLRNTVLETFVTVVECGGFTDAQYALGVTQSAISCRIRDLETELGYRICERGRAGFRLTERGELVYQKARKMLQSTSDFDAELLELRNSVTGELRVGVVDTVHNLPNLELSRAISRFLSRPNDVRFEIVVASPSDLIQGLISGTIHVAIAPFRNRVSELEYKEICTEEHRLYCSKTHPLYNVPESKIGVDILTRYPICQRTYDMMLSSELSVPKAKVTVSNMEAMAMVIESGQYLGTLPTHYAKDWLSKGDFREIKNKNFRWFSTFCLATRSTRVHRRPVELFVEDICSIL